MVEFQQNLTMVTAIENNDPSKLRIRMVERAINVYKRFANELELKIDGGELWSEVPKITPAHKNPTQIFRQRLLDSTSNALKRSPLVALESRETKRKSHPTSIISHLLHLSLDNSSLSLTYVRIKKDNEENKASKRPPSLPQVSTTNKTMVTFDVLNGAPLHSKN